MPSSPSPPPLLIRRAAVLGAGVMGAQIAAHLVNCGIPMLLFDLPARKARPTASYKRASTALRSRSPRRWRCASAPRGSTPRPTAPTCRGSPAAIS